MSYTRSMKAFFFFLEMRAEWIDDWLAASLGAERIRIRGLAFFFQTSREARLCTSIHEVLHYVDQLHR